MTSRWTILLLVALSLAAPPAAAAGRAPHYHLACGAPAGGDGSLAHPWRALDAANRVQLSAGARLLLRRGSVCAGTLAPRGSGAGGAPIVIGAYGSGPLPRIDAQGPDALVLRDIDHVVAQDLELTNRGDAATPRRGVHVIADGRPVRDVTIQRLDIHDVDGDLSKGTNGSGGVQVDALGPGPARFDGLHIAGNLIENVSRSGVSIVGTPDRSRPPADQPWPEASTGVVVSGNRIDDIGGDGIVPRGTVGAVVQDNVVSNGNLRGRGYADPRGSVCNAGIWTFHANSTLIQRNEVFGMRFNGCDGTGYDVDYDQDGTVVQFNYSHGNQGGFILLCGDDQTRRADVRFNLSIDDASTLNEAPCRIAEGVLGTLSGIRAFNNTIVASDPNLSAELIRLPQLVFGGDFQFRNNIVYATQRRLLAFPCGESCSNNLFFNLPAAGDRAVLADPRFEDAGRRGVGRLQVGAGFQLAPGSPALGAGTPVAGAPPTDYFGAPPPVGVPPAIGFDDGCRLPCSTTTTTATTTCNPPTIGVAVPCPTTTTPASDVIPPLELPARPPPPARHSTQLAYTGAPSIGLLSGGVALLVLGGAMLTLSTVRRRREANAPE